MTSHTYRYNCHVTCQPASTGCNLHSASQFIQKENLREHNAGKVGRFRPQVPPPRELDKTCRLRFGLFPPLYENMMSFHKPEVHNVAGIAGGEGLSDPQPRVTCKEDSMKCGCLVFKLLERTDRQTDIQTHRHADCNTLYPNRVESKILNRFN